MASQNTVSRDKLTQNDKKTIATCQKIVKILSKHISGDRDKKLFYNEFGKLHGSRDAGQGRGAGKLQRDALTTRGRQAKAPFSNRNFRWHPLVVANSCASHFKEVHSVSINKSKILLFRIDKKLYKPDQIYKVPSAHCITTDKWIPIVDKLKKLSMDDWIKNWCSIPASEYCTHQDAIESFAVLGLSVACSFFKADFRKTYADINNFIKKFFGAKASFPAPDENILLCPLCLSPINEYPCGLKPRHRLELWKPAWQKSKRSEGEDESLQLTHVEPLQEGKVCHTAKLTRYGHRWCNVAMTDHSVDYVVDFMQAICKKHRRIS